VKVLVIEDEKRIAAFVAKGLEQSGFVVDVCHDGDDGLTRCQQSPIDVVVLDIMLPGRDGLSVLQRLRAAGNAVPVILMTARSAPDERVRGLNAGADDYVTKPIFIDELVARVHAVLRRAQGQAVSVLEGDGVSVNLLTREVAAAGRAVELTNREYALLVHLLRSPGRVFTRIQLCEQVWQYHHDPGTNLVDVYVQRLRRKLGDDPEAPWIEAVRGVGYRWRAAPPTLAGPKTDGAGGRQ